VEYILTCFFCGTKMQEKNEQLRNVLLMNNKDTQYIDFCPKCAKKFPSCCICLYPIELCFPSTLPVCKQRLASNSRSVDTGSRKGESFDESMLGSSTPVQDLRFMWCMKCKHGGHINHIKKWFETLVICPVADCNCYCSDYNHVAV